MRIISLHLKEAHDRREHHTAQSYPIFDWISAVNLVTTICGGL